VRAAALPVGLFFLLCGCGYVGPVVPPSPELPIAVTDLSVVEQGDRIHITFSTPVHTTDNLPIKRFSEVDLRIGPAPVPFDFERWSASAKLLELQPPGPGDPDNPRPQAMEKDIPVSEWAGQRIAVAVRTAIKKRSHYSPWSNVVRVEVTAPLARPVVEAKATAQGVELTWPTEGEGLHYEIYRQGPADKQPAHIGTAERNEYLDTTAQYDTRYQYSVVAAHGPGESLPSKLIEITPVDIFPPSIPAGITALATPDAIEVSWQRSPESDLKGYYLYRSVSGGPFARVGDLLTLPTYGDHNVEHGKTYRYEVSAVDQKNNESDKSAAAEVAF
jgi:fibronectin type 3 domain-containing protein